MIRLAALPGNTSRTQLSAELVDSVQRPAFRIEPEDGDPEFVRPNPSSWNHTSEDEDQCPATVRRRDRSRPLNTFDLQIAPLVVDPRETSRTVEVAHSGGRSGSGNGVRSAKVDHPFAAQLNCFIVRSATRLRLWRVPFHGTSLPETAVLVTCDSPNHEMSALARSLAPLTSLRRKARIGDWS